MSEREAARRWRWRLFMDSYFYARHADLLAMEYATRGFRAEVAEYKHQHPPMTLKTWLIQSRGLPR